MNKPVLAVDIDDVLAEYVNSFIPFLARNGVQINRGDIRGNLIDSGVEMKWIDKFAEDGYLATLAAVPFSSACLRDLHDDFSVVAVTSRPVTRSLDTFTWMNSHFPGTPVLFSDDKGKTCRDIGAVVLIEDQIKYAMQFSPSLIIEAPWNVGWRGFRGDWFEVCWKAKTMRINEVYN